MSKKSASGQAPARTGNDVVILMPDEIVSADVLARWLGVGETAIRNLVKRGVIAKAGPNQYKLEESVRRVIEDLWKQLGRRGDRGVAAEAAAQNGGCTP
jgi:hypothetical protein